MKESDLTRKAFISANAIVGHEFPKSVKDKCRSRMEARIERVANGVSTIEQEEQLLMEQWKKLKQASSNS